MNLLRAGYFISFFIFYSAFIIHLSRRGKISMRYTLGWIAVGVCLLVGGLLSELVKSVPVIAGIETRTVFLGAAILGLLAVAIQLSVSVSGLSEAVQRLAEKLALLESANQVTQTGGGREKLETESSDFQHSDSDDRVKK